MTMHKSQGQTIPKLVVDFCGIFAPGMGFQHPALLRVVLINLIRSSLRRVV